MSVSLSLCHPLGTSGIALKDGRNSLSISFNHRHRDLLSFHVTWWKNGILHMAILLRACYLVSPALQNWRLKVAHDCNSTTEQFFCKCLSLHRFTCNLLLNYNCIFILTTVIKAGPPRHRGIILSSLRSAGMIGLGDRKTQLCGWGLLKRLP